MESIDRKSLKTVKGKPISLAWWKFGCFAGPEKRTEKTFSVYIRKRKETADAYPGRTAERNITVVSI